MRHLRSICCMLTCTMLLVLGACSSFAPANEAARETASSARAATTVGIQPSAPAMQAIRLLVPTIGINAVIEEVGPLANGDMATPTQRPWEDVGWYSQGPRPGARGSAVIDGHLDRPGGYPAVFWRLRDLHAGDPVVVLESDGKQLRLHVTHIALYPAQEAPLQDIFGNRSGSYLNLITCAGDWIPSEHQTTLRLVVYTTLG